ncbi:MAG: hypothetical protein OER85_00690 [Gammaproteobacteria bacterium]|nr:hypothetical protein [Gammaproteobacteria bacterium]
MKLATPVLSVLIEADIFARKTGREPVFALTRQSLCEFTKRIAACALFFDKKKPGTRPGNTGGSLDNPANRSSVFASR